MGLYPCFGHRKSKNGADVATILYWLSSMPQLREVFLSGQDVAIMRVIRRLVPSWAFPFFVRMASNLDANVNRGTMLLGSAVEACISEVDEYSVPKQQKVWHSMLHTDSLIVFPADRLPRATRKAICR